MTESSESGSRDLVERIWSRDPTVWTGRDEARWLGWLDAPARGLEDVDLLLTLPDAVEGAIDDVVLLGMGGSSLAPEVLRLSFGSEHFHVLDTTHPAAIRSVEAKLNLERTLFISASKSGGTLETRSHTDYFWQRAPRGAQWVAITDPGSSLEELARKRSFRAIYAGEPTIGGRYSALSPFGLVPAALLGVDLRRLLERAQEMAEACRLGEGNPGLDLGLSLGHNWEDGRDKVCVPNPHGFGLWVEQLVAESTGKQGKGLVPAPDESPDGPDRQAQEVRVESPYELGQEFFRWEFGVAVAGSILGINPFDQPNVQAAKDKTSEVLDRGDVELGDEGSVDELLASADERDYICIQAFVDPTPGADEAIARLAARARDATGCVVTHGYGPRYLHSTGQLHKGGANNGVFIQVVDDTGEELKIPGRDFGFGRLIRAQAAGDFASLQERSRRVGRVHMENL